MTYRITNITKKPGHNKGKFRRGFFVDVKPNGKVRPMWVGDFVDIEKMSPGILAMQKKEYISVEELKDLDVQIKKQIKRNELKSKETIAKATAADVKEKKDDLAEARKLADEANKPIVEVSKPSTGLDKDQMRADAKLKTDLKVKVTGDTDDNDPLGDLEDSVNPDGEPNFVVKSSTKKGGNSRKRK